MKAYKGHIYVIRNLVTAHIYIGKTEHTLEWRFKRHREAANSEGKKRKYALHQAMAEYGVENFTIELLDDTATDSLHLKNLERKYIAEYKATESSIGYNSIEAPKGYYSDASKAKHSAGVRASWTSERREQFRKYVAEQHTLGELNSDVMAARMKTPEAQQEKRDLCNERWSNPETRKAVLAKRSETCAKRNEGKENRTCEFCGSLMLRRNRDSTDLNSVERWCKYNIRRFCNQQCAGKVLGGYH